MLMLFFDKIGWPTSLPTSEKGTFLKIVLQEKKNALDDFLMSKPFPLRPGAEDFINDAHRDGVPVVVLTAYSTSGDKIARVLLTTDQVLPRTVRSLDGFAAKMLPTK